MKAPGVIGILLIILGVAGLAFGGLSFTHKEKVLDLGPIEASAEKKEKKQKKKSSASSLKAKKPVRAKNKTTKAKKNGKS